MTGPAASASRGRAARDVAVQLIGRLANLALGVVVTVVVVRALGVDGAGQWATLLAIASIAGSVADLGLEQVAVRRAAVTPEHEADWLGALAVLRVAVAVPAALLAFAVIVAVGEGSQFALAGALVAATVVAGAPQSLRAAFQLRLRNDRTIVVVTLNSVLWAAAVVVIAAAGGGLVAFAAALLAVTVVTTAVCGTWVARTAQIALRGVRTHGRELARVGVVVGIGATLTAAYGKVDQVLVLHYTGEEGAGLYGTAYMLLDRAQFAPMALMGTLYPILSGTWPADPSRTRRLVQQGFEYMALASLPALAFTLVASEPLLALLFGEDFTAAAGIVPVLMAAFVLTSFGYLVGYLALIVNQQGRFVVFALVTLVFNVALNMLLLPSHGYQAAAWVTLASEALVLSLASWTSLRALRFRPSVGRFGRIVLAAALMAIVVELLDRAGVGIVGLGAAAIAAYAAALPLVGAVRAEDRALLRGAG